MSRGNPSRLIAREQLCCHPTARCFRKTRAAGSGVRPQKSAAPNGISSDVSLASFVPSSASLLRSFSQLMLANNTFVPSSAALCFILEFIIAPRQSLCNNIFAFRQVREGRKEDGLAYLEFVSRHCTPSGTQRRNHIISESAGVLKHLSPS